MLQAEIFLCESYTRSRNNQKALFYANSAAKKIASLDPVVKSRVLRIKGISLGRMGFSEEARKLLQQTIVYANEIENDDDRNENLGYIYANLAENYRINEVRQDSIEYYYQKSFFFFDQISANNIHKGKHLAFAYVNLGTFNLKAEKFSSAQMFFESALLLSRDYELDFITIEALSGLGTVNYYNLNYKKAKLDFYDALIIAKNKNRVFYKNDLYYNLSSAYNKLNQKDSSDYYKERYIILNDSLLKSNKESIAYSLKLFLAEKEIAKTNQLFLIIIGIVTTLILIVIVFRVLNKYQKRLKRLKNEVKIIDKQIKTKEHSVKIVLSQKKDLEEEINELINMATTGNPSFFIKFEKTHSVYIEKIIKIQPNILLSELRFCALIKLGFSTAEIATYSKSSIRSVESRRYRLRKKLYLSADVDLNEWLMNL